MSIGELLCRLAEHGVSLRCGRMKNRLSYSPTGALPPALIAELRNHKREIIVMLQEDAELEQTGIIQSERQVFDLARCYFGEDAMT